jgi:methylglutaconyl-CoA hydratase
MRLVRREQRHGITLLTLDRPDKRNALTPDMFAELERELVDPGGVGRAVVLTGSGPVFCGGFDLQLCRERPGALAELLVRLSGAIRRLRGLAVPVVVGVQGAAIAGGCALLGGADHVVANEDATFGYPVVRLGLSPAVSAPFMCRTLSPGACRRLLLDPGLVRGSEARRIGLVHECVARPEDVLPAALRAAGALADKPAGAFAATKRWLREIEAGVGDEEEGWARRGLDVSLATSGSEECARALALLKR